MSVKTIRKVVLLLSISVVFCFTATSCLTFLATVGGIIFNWSDNLSENRIIVYGSNNDIAVTFQDGKMLAVWDDNSAYSYTLSITKNGETKEIEGSDGSVDLTAEGYTYRDDLKLDLAKTRNAATNHYTYTYSALSDDQYSTYTAPVQAGFTEIDRYIATRREWFDFFSYLIVFREGIEQTTEDDGSTAYLIDTNCYLAYNFTGYSDYAGLAVEECLENEVCSAIDAYEDSASYAYSCSIDGDGKTARLYLKFFYINNPDMETDSYAKYYNDPTVRVHYNTYFNHSRTFPIDSVQKTIPVSSSDQLYFALKKGYKPAPEAGSHAELLYNKMRSILSHINEDKDTDYEKLRCIYDYIINTVVYDYVFTEDTMRKEESTHQLFRYKCLYLEGVFGMQNDGSFNDSKRVAICDGLSKAYMCMATIEGIPCLKVSGTVNNEGHAWNKVKLGGSWYMVDTTWGNTLNANSKYESISYDYFLVKDDQKHVENKYLSYPAALSDYNKSVPSQGKMGFFA